MKLALKIANVKSLDDARLAASLGADYIELAVAKNSQYGVTPMEVQSVMQWIPNSVVLVQFIDYPNENLHELANLLGLKWISVDDESFNWQDFKIGVCGKGFLPQGKTELRLATFSCEQFALQTDDVKTKSFVELETGLVLELTTAAKGISLNLEPSKNFEDYEMLLAKWR
ncbi:MAG: hypothetical protein KDC92_10710 [Bacteroidetes bacterium]|nr:hypothetical protein [Bacteroidota bacterium]